MQSLPEQGVKSIQVICPGFSADCLETVEEIGEENKAYFLEAGGERYEYIPALNDSEAHINMMMHLIAKQVEAWIINEADFGEKVAERHKNYLIQ